MKSSSTCSNQPIINLPVYVYLILMYVQIPGFGLLSTGFFIASAITSGHNRSKLRSISRANHTVSVAGTTHDTIVTVQQPIPLSENRAYGASYSQDQEDYHTPLDEGLTHDLPAAASIAGHVR